ncbi:transposase [Candidatus Gracilibacteria bacterium]|nr:transposase [Candidatus Gracilibacteria bacterium]
MASLFRFARQGQYKLIPRRVSNRLRKTVVFEHVRDAQVFDGDHPNAVNQLAGLLVREVAATEADPLVNTGNWLPSSRLFGGALLLLGELPYNRNMKKVYTASFKAQLVLELLRETKTLNQLSAEYGVAPTVLREWKQAAITGLPDLFD